MTYLRYVRSVNLCFEDINKQNVGVKKKIVKLPLESKILKNIGSKHYFSSLTFHQMDTVPLDNQYFHLIRSIVRQYFNVRYKYYCKSLINNSESVRQMYAKNIIFKGQ